jgi:hypothetical protein
MQELTRSDFLSIISTIIAAASAFYTFKYTKLTNKLVNITEKDFNNKQSDFSIYLIENLRFVINSERHEKFLLFNITINNKSENKSSYKAILEIEYIREDGSHFKVLIEHNPKLIDLMPNSKFSVYDTDIRIEEKQIESNWVVFQQPDSKFLDYRIAKYVVKLVDVKNVTQEVEVFLMKEVYNEATKS